MGFHDKYTVLVRLETYGPEFERVLDAYDENPLHVWTEREFDGNIVISQGLHIVNRVIYYITSQPAQKINEEYSMKG